MSKPVIKFYPQRVRASAAAQVRRAMQVAGERVKEKIKAEVGTPYPPASAPMHFPHRRTGEHQRGIVYRTSPGPTPSLSFAGLAPHSRWLEYGTRTMAPRPTFRTAQKLFQRDVEKEVGRKLQVKVG